MQQIIGTLYRLALRPIFFRLDPEFVHNAFVGLGKLLGDVKPLRALCKSTLTHHDPMLIQHDWGLRFENPVGLAAGFDKNADLIQILPDAGFGHIEIGSVTYSAYGGNSLPRLYRLPKSKGIVVNYGLKNIGVKAVIKKIKSKPQSKIPCAISIAKTNAAYTADESAGIEDYYNCYQELLNAKVGDIYVINISCPNAFGGEPFTTKESLRRLMTRLDELKSNKPVWIKLPIEIAWEKLDQLIDELSSHQVDGLVIGNLAKDYHDALVKDDIPQHVKGGMSGKPTWQKSNRLISHTYQKYHDRFRIIGVGGIFSAQEAYHKIKLGATYIQLITGMIYMGPQLMAEINKGLVQLLHRDGYANISEAIGGFHHSQEGNRD